ncbi:hypothetical protein AB0J43_07430 [Nonomuraea fuscirosea]
MPKRASAKIDVSAGHTAIQEIVDRRQREGDLDIDELVRDDPIESPMHVVRHVVSHHRVPAWVVEHDVIAALWVLAYVRKYCSHRPEEVDRLEATLLEMGVQRKVAMARMAPPLGVAGRQGVEARILRARAKDAGLPRSEQAERAHRPQKAKLAHGSTKAEAAWYDRNALKLWECAKHLAAARGEIEDLIDDDLAENFIGLRRCVRAIDEMRWPLKPEMFPELREIAWWGGEILEGLDAPGFGLARSKVEDKLAPVAEMLRRYRAVIDR